MHFVSYSVRDACAETLHQRVPAQSTRWAAGPWQQQLTQASSQERPGDAPTLRCSLTCEGSTLAPRAKVAFPSPTDALLLAKQ